MSSDLSCENACFQGSTTASITLGGCSCFSTPKLATGRLSLLHSFLYSCSFYELMGGIKLHRYRVTRAGRGISVGKIACFFGTRQSYPWGGLVFLFTTAHALELSLCQRVLDVKYTAWDNFAHCLSMGLGTWFLLDLTTYYLTTGFLFGNLIRSSFASLSIPGYLAYFHLISVFETTTPSTPFPSASNGKKGAGLNPGQQ